MRYLNLWMLFLLSACVFSAADDFLPGLWTAGGESKPGVAELHMKRDGHFVIRHVPTSAVCQQASSELIDGEGEWSYDKDGNRLMLAFENYSSRRCVAPYAANAFVASFYHTEIVFYPNGPDDPASKLVLRKRDDIAAVPDS